MATITAYTATRMKEIEDSTIINGVIVNDELILTRYDTTQINAGNVRGPEGSVGPAGSSSIKIVTSTTRPVGPFKGLMIYETDTDKIYIWNGTVWSLWKNVVGGVLGIPGTSNITQVVTSETDLTGLSTTVTVGAGRRIKLSYYLVIVRSVLDGYSILRIKEGSTVLSQIFITNDIPGQGETRSGFILLTPSVGVHSYKLSLERTSGTGTTNLGSVDPYPSFFMAEDVGSV